MDWFERKINKLFYLDKKNMDNVGFFIENNIKMEHLNINIQTFHKRRYILNIIILRPFENTTEKKLSLFSMS